MVTKSRSATVVVLAVSLLMLVPAAAQAQIKLGGIFVLSGPLAGYGQHGSWGATLAVEEINAAGGVMGKKLELLVRDSKARPEEGVRVAEDYILRDKVDFLIGITSSAVALAVTEVSKQHKKILVVTDAATHRYTGEKCQPYAFRVPTNTLIEGKAQAKLFAKQPYKKYFVIGPDYEYGHAFWDAFSKALKELKPDVQFVGEAWPKLGTADFTAHISAAVAAKPDAVYVILWGGDMVSFIKQSKPFGLFQTSAVINARGPLQMFTALKGDLPLGMWVATPYFFTYPATEQNKKFVEAYRKRWNNEYPEYIGHESYSGVYFLKAAIEKAKSTDSDAIVKAIGEGLEFQSPKGPKWLRGGDHQVYEDVIVGKTGKVASLPFPGLVDIEVSKRQDNIVPLSETGCKM